MEDEVKHIYKKVETDNVDNIGTVKQETWADKIDKMDDNSGKINPYHELITSKVEKDDTVISQME